MIDIDHFDQVITDEEIDPIATPATTLVQWLTIHHDLSYDDACDVIQRVRARTLATRAALDAEVTPMTPADFAAHVVAPGIMNESDGDATINLTDDGLTVRTGPGDEYRIVITQTRQAPGWEE